MLRQGKAQTLLSSHLLTEVEQVCNRVGIHLNHAGTLGMSYCLEPRMSIEFAEDMFDVIVYRCGTDAELSRDLFGVVALRQTS